MKFEPRYFNQKICDREECAQAHRDYKQGKYKERKLAVVKTAKSIKNATPRKLEQLARYRKKRDFYLANHKVCEVHDCAKPSTNLHHKAGRRGFADEWARDNDISLVEDVRYFMACCETCHPKRIHENPKWARENGYILTLKSR